MNSIAVSTVTIEDGKACSSEFCRGDYPCGTCLRHNAHGKYTRTIEIKKGRTGHAPNTKYYLEWAFKTRDIPDPTWKPMLNSPGLINYWTIRDAAIEEYKRLVARFPRFEFRLIHRTETILLDARTV